MTPKKAITIVVILFLVVAMIWLFLYLKRQAGEFDINQQNQATNGLDANKSLTPAEINKQKDEESKKQIERIIEQGKNSSGGVTTQAAGAAEAAANQRMQEKLDSRTPEQIKADKERQAEIQKMLEEANSKVKAKP